MADKNEGEVEIGKIQQSEDTTSVDNSDRSKEQGCSLDDFGKETNNGSVTIEKALSKEGAKSLLSNGLKQIIVPCIEAIDGRVEATQKSQEALRQALDKLEQEITAFRQLEAKSVDVDLYLRKLVVARQKINKVNTVLTNVQARTNRLTRSVDKVASNLVRSNEKLTQQHEKLQRLSITGLQPPQSDTTEQEDQKHQPSSNDIDPNVSHYDGAADQQTTSPTQAPLSDEKKCHPEERTDASTSKQEETDADPVSNDDTLTHEKNKDSDPTSQHIESDLDGKATAENASRSSGDHDDSQG